MEFRGWSLKLPITLASLGVFLAVVFYYLSSAFEAPRDLIMHPDFHNGSHHKQQMATSLKNERGLTSQELSEILNAAQKGEFEKVANLTKNALKEQKISKDNRQYLGEKIYPLVHALPVKNKRQIAQNFYGYKALHHLFPGNELYEHREKLYGSKRSSQRIKDLGMGYWMDIFA